MSPRREPSNGRPAPKPAHGDTLGARLMGALASLVFSVPTWTLIWFAINRVHSGADRTLFLGVDWLVGAIAVSTLVAFVSPRFFASLFGHIWRGF